MIETMIGSYENTVLAIGALGLLLLIQVLVADVVGLRAGHLPGKAVAADHGNLLFRATRTVGNTNESIAVFILLVLFCLLGGADPTNTGYLAWGFVAARAAYAMSYYANFKVARSVCFGLSLVMLLGLLIVGFMG